MLTSPIFDDQSPSPDASSASAASKPHARKLIPTRSKALRKDISGPETVLSVSSYSTPHVDRSLITNNGDDSPVSSPVSNGSAVFTTQLTHIPFDKQVTYLDLSNLGLTTVDPLHLEVAFPSLITLNVSNNKLSLIPHTRLFTDRRSTSAAQLWHIDFSNNEISLSAADTPLSHVCPVLGSLNLSGNPMSVEALNKFLTGAIVADLYLPQQAKEISTAAIATIVDHMGGCLAVNGYCLKQATALQSKRYELVQQSLRTSVNQWRPQRDLMRVLHRRNMGDAASPEEEARELLTCLICSNESLKVVAKVKETSPALSALDQPSWRIPTPHSASTGAYVYNIQRSFWHQAPVQWNHWKMMDDRSDSAARFSYVFVHMVAAAAEFDYLDRETLAIITARLIDDELSIQQQAHDARMQRINTSTNMSKSSNSLSISPSEAPLVTSEPSKATAGTVHKKYTKADEDIIAQLAGDVLEWPMYVLQYIAHRLCVYRQLKYPSQPSEVDVVIVHKHIQMALTDETFADLVKVSVEFERRVKHFKMHGSDTKKVKGRREQPQADSAMPIGFIARLFSRLNASHSIRDGLSYAPSEQAQILGIGYQPQGNSSPAAVEELEGVHSIAPSPQRRQHQPRATRSMSPEQSTFLTNVSGITSDRNIEAVSREDLSSIRVDRSYEQGELSSPIVVAPIIVPAIDTQPSYPQPSLLGSDNIHTKGLAGATNTQLHRVKEREHRSRIAAEDSKMLKEDINYKTIVMKQPPLRVPRPSSCLAIQQELQDRLQSHTTTSGGTNSDPSQLYFGHNTINIKATPSSSRPNSRPATPSGGLLITATVPSTHPQAKTIESMTLDEYLVHKGVKTVCGDQRIISAVLDWTPNDEELNVEQRLKAIFLSKSEESTEGQLTAPKEQMHWPVPNYSMNKQSSVASIAKATSINTTQRGPSVQQGQITSEFQEAKATRMLIERTAPTHSSWSNVNNAVRLSGSSAAMHPFTSQAADVMSRLRSRNELKYKQATGPSSINSESKLSATACSTSLKNIRMEHRGPDTHQFIPIEIRRELERRKRGDIIAEQKCTL